MSSTHGIPRGGRWGARLVFAALFLATFAARAEEPAEHPPLRGLQGLGMYAEIGKGPFGPTDAIPLTVHLVNVGKEPLVVNARMLFGPPQGPGELSIRMLGPDNRARYFDARIGASRRSTAWQELAPGASLSTTWDLRRSHDLDGDGIYAVQVIYENAQDAPAEAGRAAWQGRLVSRIHHFRRKGEREAR